LFSVSESTNRLKVYFGESLVPLVCGSDSPLRPISTLLWERGLGDSRFDIAIIPHVETFLKGNFPFKINDLEQPRNIL
jgi:hypothetical protein